MHTIINYVKNELSFCFGDESKFNEFFNKNFSDMKKKEFIYEKRNVLFEIISNLVNNYKEIISNKFCKFIIILDQYKLTYDKNSQIDSLLKNIVCDDNSFKYIKCSSMNDMDGINQLDSFIENKNSILFYGN